MKKKEQNRKYEIQKYEEKRKAEMEEDDDEWDPELLGIFLKCILQFLKKNLCFFFKFYINFALFFQIILKKK